MSGIQNLDKINIIKRNKIKRGIEYIIATQKDISIIKKVIVFGSSVQKNCHESSDIDICLISDYNTSNSLFFTIYGGLSLVMDDLCDILIYSSLSGKIKEEIDKKGVVVYEY